MFCIDDRTSVFHIYIKSQKCRVSIRDNRPIYYLWVPYIKHTSYMRVSKQIIAYAFFEISRKSKKFLNPKNCLCDTIIWLNFDQNNAKFQDFCVKDLIPYVYVWSIDLDVLCIFSRVISFYNFTISNPGSMEQIFL